MFLHQALEADIALPDPCIMVPEVFLSIYPNDKGSKDNILTIQSQLLHELTKNGYLVCI